MIFAAALALALLVAVAVFGDSPAFRQTPVHRLHGLLMPLVGRLTHAAATNDTLWLVVKWLVPAAYCLLVLVCVAQFFAAVYPVLPVGHTAGHVLYMGLTLGGLGAATALATFTEPGHVTRFNVAAARARYTDDGLIFFGRHCGTCGLPKPARLKHCLTCGRCVLLHDHHCLWINNCVGQDNYLWFLAYVAANINFMVYGGLLCWRSLAAGRGLLSYWAAVTRLTWANKVAGTLLFLAAVFLFVATAFLVLQLRYVYLGVTTNEAEKWSEVEHLVGLGVLYYVPDLAVYVEQARKGEGHVYLLLDDGRQLFGDEAGHELRQVVLVETDLVNVYDRGFWENLAERVWPPPY